MRSLSAHIANLALIGCHTTYTIRATTRFIVIIFRFAPVGVRLVWTMTADYEITTTLLATLKTTMDGHGTASCPENPKSIGYPLPHLSQARKSPPSGGSVLGTSYSCSCNVSPHDGHLGMADCPIEAAF